MSNAATQRYLLAQRLPAVSPALAFQASHPARPGQFRIDILSGLEPAAQQAYLRDQEAVAALQHPHILPLVETASMPDGTAICVSRWPEGSPLQGRLDAGAPLAPEAAVAIITAVADALAAAHARGLNHGRLRADQILLPQDGGDGGPWLFGFGARHRLGDAGPSTTDREADLSDLANVAEQMLQPGALARASERSPSFGPLVEGVLARARQGSSETSFQSPLAFALALTLAVESPQPPLASSALDSDGAPPMASVTRKRRRHWVGLGVGVVAGAALTALLVLPGQPLDGWRASLRGWSLQAAPVMAESPPPAPPLAAAPDPEPPPVELSPPAEPPPAAEQPPPPAAEPSPPVAEQPSPAIEPAGPTQDSTAPLAPRPVRAGRAPVASRPARRGLVWSARAQRLIQVDDQGLALDHPAPSPQPGSAAASQSGPPPVDPASEGVQ